MRFLTKNTLFYLILLLPAHTLILTFSKEDEVEKEIIKDPDPDPEPEDFTVDPNKMVSINTSSSAGVFYHFWST